VPPIKMRGNGAKPKNIKKTIARLLSYLGMYRFRFVLVLVCILFSAVAEVAGSLFLKTLIDDYIAPMVGQVNPSFLPLFNAILMMAGIYVVGIVSTFLYNFIMVEISQGILRHIRDTMFSHMQTLPIRYFYTHPH